MLDFIRRRHDNITCTVARAAGDDDLSFAIIAPRVACMFDTVSPLREVRRAVSGTHLISTYIPS